MPRQAQNSARLPTPVGPFSHAAHAGELVFLAGQVGADPSTGALVKGGVAEQARQAFTNIRTVLEDLHLTFDDVVKANVFLTSMADFAAMNAVYAEHFSKPYPARTTVAVKELPLGASVEIEMVVRKS